MQGSSGRPRRVGIVGAGMSGLCPAAKLQMRGHDDFVVYEKATEVGGTWRENTYPGLSCDVPGRTYAYSFAPHEDQERSFPAGPELYRYFVDFADRSGLRSRIRFGTEVLGAEWDGTGWQIELSDGTTDRVDVLVAATGVLHRPQIPDIPGLETFEGALFHSARWDHSVPLDGRRVGVIGTGSTGVQITTALAPRASRLSLFQRTPQWIMPVPNWRYTRFSRWLYRRFPALRDLSVRILHTAAERTVGRAMVEPGWMRRVMSAVPPLHLRVMVRDPELRARLTPPDEPMCRRLVMSAGYYRAVTRPDVDVVTEKIDHVEARGIVTADGRLHELDVIALATGFDAHTYFRPMRLVGPDGLTIEELWRTAPHAYRTIALPGFPNFFMMLGPNSPIGNFSLVGSAEIESDYIIWWLDEIRRRDLVGVAPTHGATAAWRAELEDAMPGTVWTTGCTGWYLGPDGLPKLWPFYPERYRELLAVPEADHFAPVQAG